MTFNPPIRLTFLALLAALLALPGAVQAARGQQYSVALNCGTNDGSSTAVLAGSYATAVSAFNGQRDARVRARVLLDSPASAASDWVRARIASGKARSLDCDSIRNGRFTFPIDLPMSGFFSGLLVIQSDQPLDVTARYTSSGNGDVSSQVVRVPATAAMMPRRRPRDRSVEICHIPPGNPDNAHDIEVDERAVIAHMHHGDYMGACQDDDMHDHDFYPSP